MLRKLTGYLPRPSIISSQFYKSAKRKGQRSESRSAEIDRSCHLYEERERERDGISFPGAWNDRHGAIRGAERIVSIERQKSIISSPSRCDSGAVVALLPIIRGLLDSRKKAATAWKKTSFSDVYRRRYAIVRIDGKLILNLTANRLLSNCDRV